MPAMAAPTSPRDVAPLGIGEKKPKLITIRKPPGGSFGFNLHGVKGKPGQVVKSVDAGGPAIQCGLFPGDRVVEVNGLAMVGETHGSVVGRVRDSGDVVILLVVDEVTYDLYNARGLLIVADDAVSLPVQSLSIGGSSSDESRSPNGSVHSASTEGVAMSPTRFEAPPAHAFKKTTIKKRDAAKAADTDWASKRKFFDDL